MELDPTNLARLKALTGRGMKEGDLAEMARAIQGVILKIQAEQGMDREEALKLVSDTLGDAGRDDVCNLLRLPRLPGDIGTKDD